MSSSTSLKDDISAERDWCFKTAQWALRSAHEQKDDIDVSGHVETIHECLEGEELTLTDLGTTEDELAQLVQTGYESEARTCLELAQGMYGCSRVHLYVRGVRNVGVSFFKRPDWHSLKWFLSILFCIRSSTTCRDYVARVREYLAKARLSSLDIGTTEEELQMLGS